MNTDTCEEAAHQMSPAGTGAEYPSFRWFVLAAACLSLISVQIANLAYAPLLGEVAKDLNIKLGTSANIMAIFVVFVGFSLVIAGVLCDRYGIAPLIIASALCSTIPAIVTPWLGHSYSLVLLLRAIEGSALGFVMGTLSTISVQWFPLRQRGLAVGLATGFAGVGSIIAVLVSPAIFQVTQNWQRTIAWLSLSGWIALLFSVVVFSRLKRWPQVAQVRDKAVKADGSSFRQLWLLPITWIGLFLTFFALWGIYSIYGLAPSYLAEAKPVGIGFGPLLAGQFMAIVQTGAIVGPVLGGILLDRTFGGQARSVLLLGFAMAFAFYFIQYSPVHGNPFALVACLAILGTGVAFIVPTVMALGAAAYDQRVVGRMLGIWLGVGTFGGAAGLFVSAEALKRTGYYSPVVKLITVATAIGFVLSIFAVPKLRNRMQ